MRRATILAAAAALLSACGPKEGGGDSAVPATPSAGGTMAAPPAAAAVTITSPAMGDSVGADVTITLSARGVVIEKADPTQQVEGRGHHHIFLDMPPSATGAAIPPTGGGVFHIGTGDSTWTLKGLSKGPHEVIAVVAYGNHVPMPNVGTDTVRFIVR